MNAIKLTNVINIIEKNKSSINIFQSHYYNDKIKLSTKIRSTNWLMSLI